MSTLTIHKEPIVCKGSPASPGIAIGPIFIHHKYEPIVLEKKLTSDEIELELNRVRDSVERSSKELNKILEFAREKLGDDQAKILEAQVLILQDKVLMDSIRKRLKKEKKNAEFVVTEEFSKYHQIMLAAKDEYTRERAQDVEDVRLRILRNLQEEKLISKFDRACIIVAYNFSPADTLIFSRNDVMAYVSDIGGITSHTAILARAMKIPAVVGMRDLATKVHSNDNLIVCGYSGTLIINPNKEQIVEYLAKQKLHKEFEENLREVAPFPAETLDGHKVSLQANVELASEIEFVHHQGADGVGLYRTEVLLLGGEVFPTEEEQYLNYKRLAESIYPKPVIIRTFDIGGDKMTVHSIRENNPFLGWRGIRLMLDKEDLFLEQLRAILRASVRRNVSVMFPMVTAINEVRKAKQLVFKAQDQLREKGISFDEHMPIGVMVEVPAAAVIADNLAREVDFLSIGSNDLIQYLLAVDRDNELVADLFQEFHPSVVRFVRRIIERGSKGKVWVGMCGEMAGHPLATILLLGLGLQEFSVNPNVLPEIKKIIRSIHYSEAVEAAKKCLEMGTAEEIKEYLDRLLRTKFPDILID